MPKFITKTDLRKLTGVLLSAIGLKALALVALDADLKTWGIILGAEILTTVGAFLVNPRKAIARIETGAAVEKAEQVK